MLPSLRGSQSGHHLDSNSYRLLHSDYIRNTLTRWNH